MDRICRGSAWATAVSKQERSGQLRMSCYTSSATVADRISFSRERSRLAQGGPLPSRFRFRPASFLIAICLFFTAAAFAASETILHNFIGMPFGANPDSQLTIDAAGNLYGTTYYGGNHPLGEVFKLTLQPGGKWSKSVLYSFAGGPNDGVTPLGGVTFDAAGNLYGVALDGGPNDCGIVYELSPQSGGQWAETILHFFTGQNGDGCWPTGHLSFDRLGNLYGTTDLGGTAGGYGTVFELTPSSSGWSEAILASFSENNNERGYGVVIDNDGSLYSTAGGDVFRLTYVSGQWQENILCSCGAYNTGLTLDDQGNIYGSSDYGENLVWELVRQQNWKMVTLYTFQGGSDGTDPWQSLILDAKGNLYGVTLGGGVAGLGTVFKLTHKPGGQWVHKVLYAFKNNFDGEAPNTVTLSPAGNLYGTTRDGGDAYCEIAPPPYGCGTIFELTAEPQGEWKKHKLVTFKVGDGQAPQSSLISGGSGALYGTAPSGGVYNAGIVFEVAKGSNGEWQETILHSFKGTRQDGCDPYGELIEDKSGNLYGTTEYCGAEHWGAVFELSPNSDGTWTETILHSFNGYPKDGGDPVAGLIFDADGNLYGSTLYGGSSNSYFCEDDFGNLIGCGAVFKLSPSGQGEWKETVLYSFAGPSGDGSDPNSTLLIDDSGNLYGSTASGGNGDCDAGCGTIFKLSKGSGGKWTEAKSYSFPNLAGPSALTFAPDGSLYGTTASDGTYYDGTFYQVTTGSGGAWTVNPLYNFGSYQGDGTSPNGVIFDGAGNAYGTTKDGGNNSCEYGYSCGTVFMLSPASGGTWTESLLYKFNGPYSDGNAPTSRLLLDSSGNVFGTTSEGGLDYGGTGDLFLQGGTVFEITP